MTPIDPPLYGQRALGLSTCGYGTGDPECGQPASRHLLFDDVGGHNGLICDHHWVGYLDRFTVFDFHTFGGSCCMPGAVWVYSFRLVDTAGVLRHAVGGGCTIPLEDEPTSGES